MAGHRKGAFLLNAEEDAQKDFEKHKLGNVKRSLSLMNECSRWLAEETDVEVKVAIQNLMLKLSNKCSAEISSVVIAEKKEGRHLESGTLSSGAGKGLPVPAFLEAKFCEK